MSRVSIELQKQEWKFGRTRKAVETRAAGECFHNFFEISKIFRECLYRGIETRFLSNQRVYFLRIVL